MGAALLAAFVALGAASGGARTPGSKSEGQTALLDSLQRKAVEFFWREAPPDTGQVKDRAKNQGEDSYTVSSIAATGFGLAALGIGAERGWIPQRDAEERAVRTLRFLRHRMPHERGWFYHFVDMRTGERVWKCELSSIDTALLLSGALVAAGYFPKGDAPRLVDQLYRRIDFPWMLTDGGAKPKELHLSMGWKPESGFLAARWNSYCELMILYLLGLGSRTRPLPAACWGAWRNPETTYGEHRGIALDLPLFVHQYSHAFVDFRGRRDRSGFEPWQNSVTATRMNRQFCIDHAERHRGYGPLSWGLSACDGPDGYRAYAPRPGDHDGTITPWVVAASLPFAPEICLPALAAMRAQEDLWGRYSFTDAFNRDRNWVGPDVLGIDLGAALLMIENHRTGRVWKHLMARPEIQTALKRAGLQARR
jgi:hypothetical protein